MYAALLGESESSIGENAHGAVTKLPCRSAFYEADLSLILIQTLLLDHSVSPFHLRNRSRNGDHCRAYYANLSTAVLLAAPFSQLQCFPCFYILKVSICC